MQTYLCGKNEQKIAIISFVIFIISFSIVSILGISPLLQSIIESSLYITALLGIIISIQSINKFGLTNFAGKSFLYLGLSSLLLLINTFLINFVNYSQINSSFLFILNESIWTMQVVFLIASLLMFLTSYKLNIKKTIITESIIIFLIFFLLSSFFAGWPQVLNSLLITSAVISIRIAGKKIHNGILYLSLGLIILAISNVLFLYRVLSEINYFGDLSDLTLLISWIIIVIGIYCAKKHYE